MVKLANPRTSRLRSLGILLPHRGLTQFFKHNHLQEDWEVPPSNYYSSPCLKINPCNSKLYTESTALHSPNSFIRIRNLFAYCSSKKRFLQEFIAYISELASKDYQSLTSSEQYGYHHLTNRLHCWLPALLSH